MANRTKLTVNKREQFLDELRKGMSVSHAAKAIGVARQTCYEHREKDDQFAKAWDEAIEEGTEVLLDEARRRAMGWDEPVFYEGKQIGTRTMHSDTMLIFLIKGRAPEYRDRVEHTGKDGGPIKTETQITTIEVIKTPKRDE